MPSRAVRTIDEPPPGWQDRLAALMARVNADCAAGGRLATAWLARERYEERYAHWPDATWSMDYDLRCDGWSIFIDDDCVTTWPTGPKRAAADVALVTDRRMRTGSFTLRVVHGIADALEQRGVPMVHVRVLGTHPWAYEPRELVAAWDASQAIVSLLETRAHEAAVDRLVRAFLKREPADFEIPRHRASTWMDTITADSLCIATWTPSTPRRALLCGRRYPPNTFRRIVRDTLRTAFARHAVPYRELKPDASESQGSPNALIAAWERDRLRLA